MGDAGNVRPGHEFREEISAWPARGPKSLLLKRVLLNTNGCEGVGAGITACMWPEERTMSRHRPHHRGPLVDRPFGIEHFFRKHRVDMRGVSVLSQTVFGSAAGVIPDLNTDMRERLLE